MGQEMRAVDPEIAEMLEFYQAAARRTDAFYQAAAGNDALNRANRPNAGHPAQSRQSDTSRLVPGRSAAKVWRREHRS